MSRQVVEVEPEQGLIRAEALDLLVGAVCVEHIAAACISVHKGAARLLDNIDLFRAVVADRVRVYPFVFDRCDADHAIRACREVVGVDIDLFAIRRDGYVIFNALDADVAFGDEGVATVFMRM